MGVLQAQPIWLGSGRAVIAKNSNWRGFLIKCCQSLDPANVTKTSFMSVLPADEPFSDVHSHGRRAPLGSTVAAPVAPSWWKPAVVGISVGALGRWPHARRCQGCCARH